MSDNGEPKGLGWRDPKWWVTPRGPGKRLADAVDERGAAVTERLKDKTEELRQRRDEASEERRRAFDEAMAKRRGKHNPNSAELDDLSIVHKDARTAIEPNLLPGEPVRVVLVGAYDSALVATDRRAFIFKKGWLSGSFGGSKVASYDFQNLTGLEVETGKLSGSVTLQGPGIAAADMGNWDGSKTSSREAPFALMVTSQHYDRVRRAVPRLRELISNAQTGQVRPTADGPLEQLKKLGELRDAGVITTAEFEAKKAALLERL